MPTPLAWIAGVQSAVLIGLGALMFAAPARAASIWPWDITPLTSRALASWLVALAVGLALTVRSGDIAYARLTAMPYAVYGALVAVALIRYSSSVDWGTASAWVLVGVVGVIIATGMWGWLASKAATRALPNG